MADAENKMTTDYSKLPSNTDKEKAGQSEAEERETLPQLTDTPAGRRKKPVGRKFREAITGDDARSVFSYVFFDVVVPAAKDMFLDAVNEGLVRALWGDVRRSPKRVARGTNGTTNDYVPYNRLAGVASAPGGGGAAVGRSITQKARATHDFDEITLGSRGEAEVVLNALQARIAQFSVATVSDLYDYVGITGSWTDNKYGWYDLAGASIDRAGRDGYVLSLPKPELLN